MFLTFDNIIVKSNYKHIFPPKIFFRDFHVHVYNNQTNVVGQLIISTIIVIIIIVIISKMV